MLQNEEKPKLETGRIFVLTLFLPGGGQFSPDVLIRGRSNYTLNSSFLITEQIKMVQGKKNFPMARESPPKSAG